MPLTTLVTSGCSSVATPVVPPCSFDQSVLDFIEVDLRFALGCFSEGNDSDFIIGLRMSDRNGHPSQQAKGNETLFTISKARVFKRKCESLEHKCRVNKVQTMLLQVEGAFAL